MNWQSLFGNSGTADWILLTVFHSLWLSLAAFLIVHVQKLRAPALRSTWWTSMLILLLALPLITWFIPRTVVRAHPDQNISFATSAAIADSKAPLLNNLLNMKTPLPQARMNQWKVVLNQFGLLWVAVTLGCVGRLLYELAFLRGYCTGLQEIEDDRISAIFQEINESFNFREKPRFFVSPSLDSPISMGMQTPLVIFPASLYQSVGNGELRAILLHELAHIYHRDHVLGLLQRVVKVLYWWNPLVYRICNTLSVAREEVCDNYAISGMESAAGYATLLVSLIEKTSLINRMPCAAGMATPYESLEIRIKNIVSKERDMRTKTNKGMRLAIVAIAVLLCGLVGVGSHVRVFGQDSHPGDAKPIVVDIKNTGTNFKMDLLQGSRLILRAPDAPERFESSPIIVNDNQGSCEFSEPIPPGSYKLLMNIFALSTDVVIPPTPYPALPLHINIAPGSVSIFADLVLRNEKADIPQTNPIQLDASTPPVVLSRVELEYPTNARWAKISGIAKVQVIVNEKGEVYEAKLLAGHPWFQKPALNAVVDWKFQPMFANGELKPFVTTVTLDYRN